MSSFSQSTAVQSQCPRSKRGRHSVGQRILQRSPVLFTIIRWPWRLLHVIFYPLFRIGALLYIAAEYTVLLFPHRKEIRNSSYVRIQWFWNFGHQALEPHILALHFRNKNLLMILSDYGGYNEYIIDAFRPHIKIISIKHSPVACFLRRKFFDHGKRRHLLFKTKNMIAQILGRKRNEHMVQKFIIDSFAKGGPISRTPDGRPITYTQVGYYPQYIALLQKHADMDVSPSLKAIGTFKDVFQRIHPQLAKRRYVSLYLRQQGRIRDASPEPYREIIRHIYKEGGMVFCGGDYDPHEAFPEEEGVLGYHDFPCDRTLTDIFFLTQATFCIGLHSGTLSVAGITNIPFLITNCPFHDHSGFRKQHLILYSTLMNKETDKQIRAPEIFSPPVRYFVRRKQFDKAGINIRENTQEELLAATNEMMQRFWWKKNPETSSDMELYERFHALSPPNSWGAATKSRPVLSYLRSLSW